MRPRRSPWVPAATVGFALLVAAGVTSHRIARRRLRHETWWVVHLYTYLALALAFAHQVLTGASFVGPPIARACGPCWWQAHPYSLSSLPRAGRLRVTVKDLGDHGLASLKPGARVTLEGPYGAFTAHARRSDRVLLIAAGVGAADIPALLEDLPDRTDVVVINRASTAKYLVLRDEIAARVHARAGTSIELTGSRRDMPLDTDHRRRTRRGALRPTASPGPAGRPRAARGDQPGRARRPLARRVTRAQRRRDSSR